MDDMTIVETKKLKTEDLQVLGRPHDIVMRSPGCIYLIREGEDVPEGFAVRSIPDDVDRIAFSSFVRHIVQFEADDGK